MFSREASRSKGSLRNLADADKDFEAAFRQLSNTPHTSPEKPKLLTNMVYRLLNVMIEYEKIYPREKEKTVASVLGIK